MLVVVPVGAAVGVAVLVLVLLSRVGVDSALDKLVKLLVDGRILRREAHSDTPDAADLGADLRAHGVLQLAETLDGPGPGHSQFEIDEVVLARLDATDVAQLGDVAVGNVGNGTLSLLAHRSLELVVDADVGQLVQGHLGVVDASLDDHQRDEEAADGIQPGGVFDDVGANNGSERNDARQTVDAVVDGVGGED